MVSLEFFIDIILPATLWPGIDSAYNSSGYQEYLLGGKGSQCVRLTTWSPKGLYSVCKKKLVFVNFHTTDSVSTFQLLYKVAL